MNKICKIDCYILIVRLIFHLTASKLFERYRKKRIVLLRIFVSIVIRKGDNYVSLLSPTYRFLAEHGMRVFKKSRLKLAYLVSRQVLLLALLTN